MTYIPSPEILQKYADVLVWFALNDCQGIAPGDVVQLQIPECAKPMLLPLQKAVLERGGHPIIRYFPDGTSRQFFELANQEQIDYMPQEYMLGRVADIDHSVSLIAETDKKELEWIDPKKIMWRGIAAKFYRDALNHKEAQGKFSRTLGLYGTQAMADEVGMSLEEYRQQIIFACFLDKSDPVQEWKTLMEDMNATKARLNSLPIERVHIKGEDVDLKVQLGKDRKRLWCSGRNIPSFEHFISPDWRGTEGWIKFNQPLYRYGNVITWVELQFNQWKVTDARAATNQDVLLEMIHTKNADKIGEFSLTDSRFSRITKFMGETLYDENVWGPFGNTHIALGMAYKDSYPGDQASLTEQEWEDLWYNDSVVHTDIVSTTDRTVVATLVTGQEMVIYEKGRFVRE